MYWLQVQSYLQLQPIYKAICIFLSFSYLLKSAFEDDCHCHDYWIWHQSSFFYSLVKNTKVCVLQFFRQMKNLAKVI